jgi:predicted transcriptional regulator
MRKNNVKIKTGSASEFFDRVRGHAEKLDRGESLPAESTTAFEDPMELLNVLTAERVRLLRRAKAGSLPISDLASGLKRDVRAVSRDVVVWRRQACCALAIARIQDTAGSRSLSWWPRNTS